MKPTTLFSLAAPRRGREEILDHFNKTLRLHELIVNKLSVERRGLMDHMHSGTAATGRDEGNKLKPQDRLTIRDLAFNITYHGRFILCRILTGSYRVVSVMTVVEDPTGAVERLCLNNWSDTARAESWNLASRSYIPIGTIVAIQNPRYVMASDGNAVIQLDTTSDLIVLSNHHAVLFGVTWSCLPTKGLEGWARASPKMERYRLNSGQTTPENKSGLNLLLTPPPSGSKGKHVRSHSKRSKRIKSKKGSNILMAFSSKGENLSDRDSYIVLSCCFAIFVWYVFFA